MKKTIKTLFFVLMLIMFLCFPILVDARSGCCSWHGGEAGCSGNSTVCADGTISSCPCDGTSSSSSDYNLNSSSDYALTNYEEDADVGIIDVILGFLIFMIFAGFAEFIINQYENYKKWKSDRKNEYERKLKENHLDQIESQKEKNFTFLIENIEDEEEIEELINNIDEETISRYTSDDLIEIVNTNSNFIFQFLDLIDKHYINGTFSCAEYQILNNFSHKILKNKKLNNLQKKCIKYILDSEMDISHETLFLDMLKYKHISLVKYVLNNCNNLDFSYSIYGGIEELFNYLLEINDLELVKKLSNKKNFKFSYDGNLLKDSTNVNFKNKYLFFSLLYKKQSHIHYTINDIIDQSIDFNDEKDIINKINYYSKMGNFLEENGYYIIYFSIKKRKNTCVEYILNNFENINLDKKVNGMTPLMYACYRRFPKIVEMLLNYGADGNLTDENGNNALEYACYLENMKIVKLLFEKGYKLNFDEYNKLIEKAILFNNSVYLPYLYIKKLANMKRK